MQRCNQQRCLTSDLRTHVVHTLCPTPTRRACVALEVEVVKMASIAKRPRNKRNPYAVRYRDPSGRQREESFHTWNEARARKAELEHSTATGSYRDPRLGRVAFADYAGQVIARLDVSPGTRRIYTRILTRWLTPWANGRTVAEVAEDRSGVADLLNGIAGGPDGNGMRGPDGKLLSYNHRGSARTVIMAVIGEAIAEGKIASHRLAGIKLVRNDPKPTNHDDFVFPSFAEVSRLADALGPFGIAVWVARGCGLRPCEALAVERQDFMAHGTVLRVSRQSSTDGTHAVPLKHRQSFSQYRDVPVPGWLWDMVKLYGPGPLVPSGNGTKYASYNAYYARFKKESARIGIPKGFSPHSLRHAYATALLRAGVPIHIVSQYLGHKSVEITSRVYAHVLPADVGMVRAVLDREFADWQHAAESPAAA